MIKETGEFVINLTTEELAYATDYCGVVSGRDIDKFEKLHFDSGKGGYRKSSAYQRKPGEYRMSGKRRESIGEP